MATLDIDSVFTNIPLNETVDICIDKLFQNPEALVNKIPRNDFCDLLNLAIKKSFFTFNSKFYIQVGVAMGFPGLINVKQNLKQLFMQYMLMIFFMQYMLMIFFMQYMLMIFLYFLNQLNHLNLPTPFGCPVNTRI